MAFIQRNQRKSAAKRKRNRIKLQGHVTPDEHLNNSNSSLVKRARKMDKKSVNSHYISNSRSGLYAFEDDFQNQPLNPFLFQVRFIQIQINFKGSLYCRIIIKHSVI